MLARIAIVPLAVVALVAAGCGGGSKGAQAPQPTTTRTGSAATTSAVLRVGVVGPLTVDPPAGVDLDRGPLARVAGDPLVLVSATTVGPKALAAAADANPASHFALIGASTAGSRRPNVVGVRFREDQAAFLAGSVAGLTARHASPGAPSVAWVGPEDRSLLGAFARGARAAAPGVVVRHRWSRDEPVYCKEAAIAAIQAGATVVAADDGLCAEGAATAAHEQGQAAVSVASFKLRDVAAQLIVKEARAGVFYGNEDLTLGAASGAIGIGTLDPAIPPSVVVQASVAAQKLAIDSGSSG